MKTTTIKIDVEDYFSMIGMLVKHFEETGDIKYRKLATKINETNIDNEDLNVYQLKFMKSFFNEVEEKMKNG